MPSSFSHSVLERHDRRKSYLLDWFRDFYSELVEIKHLIQARLPVDWSEEDSDGKVAEAEEVRSAEYSSDFPAGEEGWFEIEAEADESTVEEGLPETSDADAYTAAVTARRRLMAALERQERAAERIGGEYSFTLYKEAQYVMAAVADEVMLNLDWKGRSYWQNNLIEARLFETENSGERFFQIVDRVLREYDVALLDLARICYMCLALGFQGRYRAESDSRKLISYQERLFKFIASADPSLRELPDVLISAPYRHTLVDGDAEKVPDPRRWIWVLLLVAISMSALSIAIWKDLTGELDRRLDAIPGMVDERPRAGS